MTAAFEQLIQYLDNRELKYQQYSEDQTIVASFRGGVGSYHLIGRVGTDDDLFQVFGEAPLHVPEGSRPAIAEAIARVNFGLKVGKFEMDLNDGELRFHAYHILETGSLSDEVIHRLIGTTLAMLERYVPAFLSVIYGNELPKDAIGQVEAGFRS